MSNMRIDLRQAKVLKTISDGVAVGLDYTAIASELKSKYKIEAQPQIIKKVYDHYMDIGIKSSEKIQKQVEEQVLNISEQLKKINKMANELIDKYYEIEKTEPSNKSIITLLSLMKEIQSHILIQERLLEKMSGSKQKTQVSNLYITKVIVQNIKQLEEQGFVKILKKLPMETKEEEIIEEEIIE